MIWIFAVIVITTSTIAATVMAMLFLQWMLEIHQFFHRRLMPSDTFGDSKIPVFSGIS
jgi:hypothetical protein